MVNFTFSKKFVGYILLVALLNVMLANNARATTCGGATSINPALLPISGQALVCGSTNDLSSTTVSTACGGASNSYKGGLEALYTLTPTITGNYTISIAGQTWTAIFVYAGCPTSGGTCVGSIGSNTNSKNILVTLTAGITYYIWFDTWPTPNSPCSGTFSITAPVPVFNPCSSIPNISACGTATTATIASGNGAFSNNTCGFGTPGKEQIYTFTPATTGSYNISQASSFGYIDYMWKPASGGCVSTGWTCFDDLSGAATSATPATLTAGTQYYIMLDPEGTGGGSVNFTITCAAPVFNPCSSIPNISACGTATTATIASGNGAFSNNTCVFSTPGKEQIYTFTPATTGSYNISQTSSFGYIDYMWKPASGGCVSTGWTCFDDLSGAATSATPATLTAGTQYYIMLDPEGTGGGSVNFTITCAVPDPCLSISAISCGTPVNTSLLATGSTMSILTCDAYDVTAGQEAIYSYTPATTGNHTLTINSESGTSDYVDFYYKAASGGCNGTGWSCFGATSLLTGTLGTVSLTAGTQYYILADRENFLSNTGTTTKNWTLSCPPVQPTVISISPTSGCAGAFVPVTITGNNFSGATNVFFNGIAAASFTVNSNTEIVATPANTTSTGNVQVQNSAGLSPQVVNFTVNPSPALQTVTGGSGCTNTGVAVGLANSVSGVSYQLQLNGVNNGSPVVSGGGALNFGLKTTPGIYTVQATSGGCTISMTGNVVVNPNPTAPTANVTPNLICSGGNLTLTSSVSTTSAYNYNVNSIAYSLATPSGAPTVLAAAPNSFDEGYGVVSIPFVFDFYGTYYTSLEVTTNGTISFTPTGLTPWNPAGDNIPTAGGDLDNYIGGPWIDMNFSTGTGVIRYFTNGTAPNRVFVMSWENATIVGSSDLNTSQIQLYEGSNIIEVHVGNGGINAPSTNKLIGVENVGGTRGTAAPGRNAGTWVTSANEAFRFTPTPTYSWAGPNSYTSSVQNPPSFASGPSGGNYVVTFTAGNGCTATASAPVTVSPCGPTTWLGGTPDWHTAGNWSGGIVPNSCAQHVIIPVTPNNPVVTTAVSVGNIQVDATVNVTLNNNLSVCGNVQGGNGTNAQFSGSGYLILGGTSPQSISGRLRADYIRLINPTGAVMQPNSFFDVFTELQLQTGNLNTTSGTLRLLSTAANQCAIINDFGSNTGTLTGNITAQRYIGGTGNMQHQMGSPVNNTPFSQLGANGTAGYYIPTASCSELQAGSGSPLGNVFQWNENRPNSAPGLDCILDGWEVMVGGTTQNARGYSINALGGTTKSVTGAPNLGTTYTVSGTNSNYNLPTQQSSGVYTFESGWSLFSNPFPSGYTYTAQSGWGANGFIYIPAGPFNGTYQALTPGMIIAPFQGIMLYNTTVGSTPSYNFTKGNRALSGSTVFNQNNNAETLKLQVSGNGYQDMTQLSFNTAATAQFDAELDLRKQRSNLGQPTLFTGNNVFPYALNAQTSVAQTSTVDLGLIPGAAGTFTITAEGISSFDPTSYIYLEDKVTGAMQNLRANTSYTFSMTATEDVNRFVLHFTPKAELSSTNSNCAGEGQINIEQPGTANWSYTVVDHNTTTIATGTLNQNSPIQLSVAAGVYTVTLIDNNGYTVVKQMQVTGASPITANFSSSKQTAEEGEQINFTVTTPSAINTTWSMGDGTTYTTANATHQYQSEGSYTVTLTVTNADGCTDTKTQVITVTAKEEVVSGISHLTDKNGIAMWSHGKKVYIDFSKQKSVEASIEIYNILGQQLVNEKFGKASIYSKDLQNLEAAYIIVRVNNNGELITKKLFVADTK